MNNNILLWGGLNLFVLLMLALDLGVFHRKAHEIKVKEAAIWSAVWVSLSMIFAFGVYRYMGPQKGLEFVTGYLIEYALSVDNIFVFVLIFSYFNVPPRFQHRVLFWGILGALVMRGTMIGMGAFLVARFHWILYVFGAFLVFTGIRMALQKEEDIEPEANPVIRLVRRFLPVTNNYHGAHFLIKQPTKDGSGMRWVATPLLVVLILVETTDLIFAVDSIPAIFAVTQDPFLVYSSNIFAILGLRSLYFLLAGVIRKFHYLKIGLSLVLVFIGTKMLIADWYKIPIVAALLAVAGLLAGAVVASLLFPKKLEEESPVDHDPLMPRPGQTEAPIDCDVEPGDPSCADDATVRDP